MSIDNTFNIYILKCTNNKYYIGKTKLDVEKRYSQHLYDKSCVFTTKYPPIEIITTYKIGDPSHKNLIIDGICHFQFPEQQVLEI